jgi:hypothetical protein
MTYCSLGLGLAILAFVVDVAIYKKFWITQAKIEMKLCKYCVFALNCVSQFTGFKKIYVPILRFSLTVSKSTLGS